MIVLPSWQDLNVMSVKVFGELEFFEITTIITMILIGFGIITESV